MKSYNKMNNFSIKIILIISFFALGNLYTISQEKNHFGIKSGIVLANQSWISQGDPYGDYKPGFTAGLYYTRDIWNQFSLQGELNYLQQGSYLPSSWDEYYSDNGVQKQDKFSLNYLSFVLFTKIKLLPEKFTPYFYIGPRFDILEYSKSYGFEIPIPPDKFDYGFSTGIGLETNLSKKLQIKIEIRFNQGFNKIIAMGGVVSGVYVQNQSFEFVLCLGKNF